ncbi:MAG TPA: hypothetical protein VIU62_19535 [Chloroflexota bacterium]
MLAPVLAPLAALAVGEIKAAASNVTILTTNVPIQPPTLWCGVMTTSP